MAHETVIQAQALMASGHTAEAQQLLEPYIQNHLQDVDAWLLEAGMWPSDRRVKVLEIAQQHNPKDVRVALELERARQPIADPEPVAIASAPPATPAQPKTKKCPYCAETILADAVICRYCKRGVTKQAIAQAQANQKAVAWKQLSAGLWQLGCSLLVLGVIAIFWGPYLIATIATLFGIK